MISIQTDLNNNMQLVYKIQQDSSESAMEKGLNHIQNLVVVTETTSRVPVRIHSQFISNFIDISRKQRVFDLCLYADRGVYFSTIYTSSLNKQLNWDSKFFSLLKDCLNGKNKNIAIEFSSSTLVLKVYCDFEESSIRILFFQAQLTQIRQSPMQHAQQLLRVIDRKNKEELQNLHVKCRIVENQIQKINQMNREIKDMQEFQIQYIKNKFIPVINQAKTKLRPHFNPSLPKQPQPPSQDSEESQTRKIYRIQKSSSSNLKIADFQKLFD